MITKNLYKINYGIYDSSVNINSELLYFLKNIVGSLKEKTLITDNKFRVLISNVNNIQTGENIFYKFKLKNNCIGKNISEIKRTLVFNQRKTLFKITVKKLSEDNFFFNGYMIILQDILKEDEYREQIYDLINFLKHDLQTPILSQITALKLILSNPQNINLIDEILTSSEFSLRILKNHIKELECNIKEVNLAIKENYIKNFANDILQECQKIFHEKRNRLNFIISKNSKIFVDYDNLKEALVNILFQVNEYCEKDQTVNILSDISHKVFRIKISFPNNNFSNEFFIKQKYDEHQFHKLGEKSGLYTAKRIIKAHNGNIKISDKNNLSTIKIYIPQN